MGFLRPSQPTTCLLGRRSGAVDRPVPHGSLTKRPRLRGDHSEGRAQGGCESRSGEQRIRQETARQIKTLAGPGRARAEQVKTSLAPGHSNAKGLHRESYSTPPLTAALSRTSPFSTYPLRWGHWPHPSHPSSFLSASDVSGGSAELAPCSPWPPGAQLGRGEQPFCCWRRAEYWYSSGAPVGAWGQKMVTPSLGRGHFPQQAS